MGADVADVAGNQLAGAVPMSFSTPILAAANVPLAIASIHPGVPCTLTGGTAASPGRCSGGDAADDKYHPFSLAANEPIHVTFTQPPSPASITHGTSCNAGSVRIEEVDGSGACTAAVSGTFLQHDRVVSFIPDVPWQVGKHYRLTLVSGTNSSCVAGEVCGITGIAASFDPLAGDKNADAGGPDLVIDFAGAAATDATLMIAEAAPFTDVNGSGFVDTGEQPSDANRVALRITGTTGIVASADFDANTPDCLPQTPGKQGCMYLSGAMPVELLPLTHDCALPGGETAASCIPLVLSPQVMYATSVGMDATVVTSLNVPTGLSVMRIREPAGGPVTGYLIDDKGTPTVVLALTVYLDAHDMDVPALGHDLHSKPLSLIARGPLRFLPDGRITISVANVADVPITVNLGGALASVKLLASAGELKLQLVSPPLRGGLP